MKPYLTILVDSFRMLKARAIFWVTLGISLLVALIYLSIGFDEKGMSFFFGLSTVENDLFKEGTPQSASLYVAIFTKLIAEYWLSWIAVVLALISCSAIYPESLKEGAAGMVLTKKPSRLNVFIAKFVGSLLFVFIQVTLFVFIVFIALKWRLGSWNPSIFWYVPLILLVFTYLYSFMTLIAVRTKSAMTALILTLVLWLISSIVGLVEGQLYNGIQMAGMREHFEVEDVQLEETTGNEDVAAAETTTPPQEESEIPRQQPGPPEEVDTSALQTWHYRLKVAYGFFPKTGRTMEVGDRLLEINGEKGIARGDFSTIMMRLALEGEDRNSEFIEINEESADRHSTAYAIGTSLGFSFVMLALAGWIFCRKEI